MAPVGFPPGFYPQYTSAPGRPGDPPTFFPAVYFAAPQVGDGEVTQYHMQPSFYPSAAFIPYGQPFAPYMIQRPDGQMVMASYPMYPKPPSAGGPSNQDNHPKDSDEEMTVDQEEEDDDKVADD